MPASRPFPSVSTSLNTARRKPISTRLPKSSSLSSAKRGKNSNNQISGSNSCRQKTPQSIISVEHSSPPLFSTQPDKEYTGHTFALNAKLRDLETESLFFQTQVEVLFEQEYERMKLLGLEKGMRVLDIGGGCGFFLKKMLEVNGNSWNNRIWLLERDEDLCKRAKSRVLKHHGNTVRILNADAIRQTSKIVEVIRREDEVDDLHGHKFDFIMMRFVVQHIPRPKVIELLRCIAKHLLRPKSGTLVIVEADDEYRDLLQPDVPSLQYLEDVYYDHSKERSHKSVNADFLLKNMKIMSYESVTVNAVVVHSRSHPKGIEAFLPLLSPKLFRNLVPAHVSRARFEAIDKTFRSTFNNGNKTAFTMSVVFVYSGQHTGQGLGDSDYDEEEDSSNDSSDESD